jgi:hypothetical protein
VLAIGQNTGEVAGITIRTKTYRYQYQHVTLYLNRHVSAIGNYIVESQPKESHFNPGTENPRFYQIYYNLTKSKLKWLPWFCGYQSIIRS